MKKGKRGNSVSNVYLFYFICARGTYNVGRDEIHVAEEAQTSVKGMEENAIHAKYIELVSPRPSGLLTESDRSLVCRIEKSRT